LAVGASRATTGAADTPSWSSASTALTAAGPPAAPTAQAGREKASGVGAWVAYEAAAARPAWTYAEPDPASTAVGQRRPGKRDEPPDEEQNGTKSKRRRSRAGARIAEIRK
jgi:hypothetical protein